MDLSQIVIPVLPEPENPEVLPLVGDERVPPYRVSHRCRYFRRDGKIYCIVSIYYYHLKEWGFFEFKILPDQDEFEAAFISR